MATGCKNDNSNSLPDGMYAVIETSKGDITCTLAYNKTPVTVASFVSLAEGKNTFAADGFKGKKFFDGLTFHRVVEDFVIQGGDPMGDGSGGPGYAFADEITDLTHDREGILSMANAGPGTNGSQFFITLGPQPDLDGRHTVFGYVVDGMDVVRNIAVGDTINKVTIIRNGEQAKKFDAEKVFKNYVDQEKSHRQEREKALQQQRLEYDKKYKPVIAAKKAYFDGLREKATKTKSGVRYHIISKGNGKKPENGTMLKIHYAGYLEDGHLFDTSMEAVAQEFGSFDERRKSQMGYSPISVEAGRRQGLIPGFAEGIEQLGYGDKAVIYIPAVLGYGPQGAGDLIPPDANLIFEIEIVQPTK